MSDLRLTLRSLRRNPGFALVAVLSLALGTGANIAIFSLIDTVMLRLLPVAHPGDLVFVDTRAVQVGGVRVSEVISASAMNHLGEHAASLAGIAGFRTREPVAIGVGGQIDRAAACFVSPDYFSVLGVPAVLGRTLNSGDAQPGARVAVLSYAYWQRRFGGAASILGREITLNTVPFVVAGITPREFYGLSAESPADVTVPFATQPQVLAGKISSEAPKPDADAGLVFARLKPGVALTQADAELTGLLRQALAAEGQTGRLESSSKVVVELAPASQGVARVRHRFSEPLKVLMAVVALVLLIACANIANLLLAKASGRRREIAIRMSLGSSRWRIVRQLLVESLLLAAAGGALGFLFAIWARDAIVRAVSIPEDAFQWDYRLIAFTAGVCLLSALLFGTMPALRATALDFAAALKSGDTGRTTGRFTPGRVLIAAQAALSLALLMGASLFLRSFRNLDRIDVGYARADALLVTLDPQLAGYRGPRLAGLYQQATDRIAKIPGIRSVTLMRDRLMTGRLFMNGVFVPGYTPRAGEDPNRIWAICNLVGPHFFATSGMQITAGRDFTGGDNLSAPKVAVVNQSMARHFFGTDSPVGRRFFFDPKEPSIEIVGVVRDLKYFGVREGQQDIVFTPVLQSSEAPGQSTLLVRAAEPSRIIGPLRAAIRAIDPSLAVSGILTVDQQVEKSLAMQRLIALLSAFFGLLALALAGIGLYGVLSYAVAQRTGEIGIRMALGAPPAAVLRMILSETARLILIGVACGTALALPAAQLIRSMLYGVSPADPVSLSAAAAILLGAALLATLLPARRASRVDPMVALRHE